MKVSFAIGVRMDSPKVVRCVSRLVEEAGFEAVLVGDSPAILRETYVTMAAVAFNTSSCRIGSFVTNPLSRHPVVTISAITAVNELSGGRAFLGIATGDSGVYNLGLKAATLANLEEYITALQNLWRTSEATYKGKAIRFMWSRQPVPIYMAAGGPKSLQLAGRIADGVFIEAGLLPEVIEDSLAHLSTGAREVGRKVEGIDVWWYAKGNLGPNTEVAAEQIRSGLASSANHTFRFTLEGKRVPEELRDKVEALKRQYVFHQHVQLGGHIRNAQLVDELGLRDYLAERFAIVGTPKDWVKRIEGLARLGVRKIALASVMPDKEKVITTLGREVLPAFRS